MALKEGKDLEGRVAAELLVFTAFTGFLRSGHKDAFTPEDRDELPQNKVYDYSLSGPNSAHFEVFRIPSGAARIVTSLELSYDALPFGRPFYEVILTASSPPGSATTLIRIPVTNANNQAPTFISSDLVKVPRNFPLRTAFYQAGAIDRDGSTVTFNFASSATLATPTKTISDIFNINPVNGQISMTSPPSIATNYTLNLVAQDDGTCPGCPAVGSILTSQIFLLTVQVYEVNLHRPSFTSCQATFTLLEASAAGTILGTVSFLDYG
ncbi:unnamed protein product [Protopolystoma xenopodis]|uniref:Cadherin domain-containing protein n=1 Tax=Protopolystoma xenopodis TaxID=117903 RepID=A0A3S5ANL3_9PLAT|nr:unnamed protein product [Protopolystoma xenopodis]